MIAQIMDMPRDMHGAADVRLDAPVFRLAAANGIVPRFEFRIFGHDFNPLEQRIRKVAPCESIVESREIYILSDENGDRNVKIRAGKLEFKRLIDRVNGLERWKPTGSLEFPIEREAIPDKLFPVAALERSAPLPGSLTAVVTEKEFLHHIAQNNLCGPRLYRANLLKRRSRFTLQDCPVEVDRILVNGAAIESIAIESQCAEQVLAVRSALGLEQFENVAYPLAISRVLGIRPLPDAENYE
ncbi:hypothetical protein [Nitrosospira sp. NpAV]|uniref:hypothetical protein n=1 Tax=Nitrosospira sp. NpAV TaxID=58133 RepID=UPI0005A29678|nr:hypothetical protein [Nitrosospira sp. NpAV]KIO48349.1 hypothetical protein SQ11_11315 [Nitrosospira sp. NpAV]